MLIVGGEDTTNCTGGQIGSNLNDPLSIYTTFPSLERVSPERNIPSILVEKTPSQRENLFKKEVERYNK